MTRPTTHIAVLRLGGVTDKAGFLDRCARDLRFPHWFGRNWDALADCLTDLSWWGEPTDRVLRIDGWAAFSETAPQDAATARQILDEAGEYWTEHGFPLTVVYDPPDAA